MGMGAIPCNAYCIEWSSIQELCPQDAADLEDLLKRHKVGFRALARLMDDCSPEHDDPATFDLSRSAAKKITAAWNRVAEAFEKATLVGGQGLALFIGWYDPDLGDRYDQIDGDHYFAVEGTHQLTPAGDKFQEVFQYKCWTVYG